MKIFLSSLVLILTAQFSWAYTHSKLTSLSDADQNVLAEAYNTVVSQNPEIGNCPPFFYKVKINDFKEGDDLQTALHAFLSEQVGLDEDFDFAYLRPLDPTVESFKTTLYSLSEHPSEGQKTTYDQLAQQSSTAMSDKNWQYLGGFAHYYSIKNKTSNLIKIRMILDLQNLEFFVVGNGACRKVE